jgi:hypothetical protein
MAVQYLEKIQRSAYLRVGIDPDEIAKKLKDMRIEIRDEILKQKEKISSSEEFKQYKKSFMKNFELVLNRPLLTKYEDPFYQDMLQRYSNDIEEGTKYWQNIPEGKLKRCLENFPAQKSEVIFGIMPLGTVNAMSIVIPKSDDFLIVFESELFTYCLLMSKIVASCMIINEKEEQFSFNMDENEIMKKIENDKQLLMRFQELVFGYLIDGTPGRAPRYLVVFPYEQVVRRLLDSMEIFILGHEYAHILLGHVGHKTHSRAAFLDDDTEVLLYKHEQEFEADFVGLFLSLGAMKIRGCDFSLGYWGVELFFCCDEIIEKGLCILRTGSDDWYWRGGREDGPLGTHPPAKERRDVLREIMKHRFGELPVKLGDLVEKIMTRLWEKTRPALIQHYLDHSKPHIRWQQISNV